MKEITSPSEAGHAAWLSSTKKGNHLRFWLRRFVQVPSLQKKPATKSAVASDPPSLNPNRPSQHRRLQPKEPVTYTPIFNTTIGQRGKMSQSTSMVGRPQVPFESKAQI